MSQELNPAAPGAFLAKKARSIWIEQEPAPNTWACFRHRFGIADSPAKAIAHVAVDSKYWLWLNGELIVREGGLKRGPTPTAGYVDEVDLTAHLRTGENTLAVLVWHFGKDGGSHRSSGRAYLRLRLAVESGQTIETSSQWRGLRHPSFLEAEQTPTLNGKVVLPEHAIDFDAQRDLAGWTEPNFDDSAWPPAVELEGITEDPADRLRPIGFWLDGDIHRFRNESELALPRVGPCELIGELPANLQVYPWLQVRAQGGEAIRIQVERHKFSSTYRCREGENVFEVPAWGNGHWVRYEVPAGVTVEKLGYRQTMFPAPEVGEFSASEAWMNTLWRKAVATQLVCMRDTFMDCPDRERSPWPGDFANMVEFCGYALGGPALDLVRKSMAEFVAWRSEEGILWGPTPTGRFRGAYREFPAQSLATVAVGLRDFWWHTGELSFLREVYPAVRHYILEIYRMDANGHVPHRGSWKEGWDAGTQPWYDWGGEQDMALMDQVWYGCALQTLGQFAEACGDVEAVSECRDRLLRGKEFLQSWWDPKAGAYRSPDFQHAPDPRGNALAVLAGMTAAPVPESLVQLLSERETNGIYMEKHVIDALYGAGRPDLALARTARRYGPDLASACSTLPESFGEGCNHAWGVGPAAALVRELVGLRPQTPGWSKFILRPADVPVKHCSARVPAPVGEIAATIERSEKSWRLEVECPEDASGILELPARFSRIESSHAGISAKRSESGWRLPLPVGYCEIVVRV